MLTKPWIQRRISRKIAPGCIHLDGSEYGEIGAFELNKVHAGCSYGSPRGLLIPETQHHLFRKLTDCILEGASLSGPQASEDPAPSIPITETTYNPRAMLDPPEKYVVMVSSKWRDFLEKSSHTSLNAGPAAHFELLPFSSPPVFDLARTMQIIADQTHEAIDELWLLETDFKYVCEQFLPHGLHGIISTLLSKSSSISRISRRTRRL